MKIVMQLTKPLKNYENYFRTVRRALDSFFGQARKSVTIVIN